MATSDPVDVWIGVVAYEHSGSQATAFEYRHWLEVFCNFIGKTPTEILEEYRRAPADEKVFDFKQKYANFLRDFIFQQHGKGYAKGSIRTMVSVVKSFFSHNDLPLGRVPKARNTVKFHNRDITKEEVQRIQEASRPRDKAFFCMMAQSGLRPVTLCKLKLKHLEPDFSEGRIPCKIEVPQDLAKGRYRSYFTFMGPESMKYLRAYLAMRPGIGPDDYLFVAHGRDKKADPHSLTRIFVRIIEKLREKGLIDFEQKQFGKPRSVRLYNLRKYFRKHANQAGFEFVQFWMGHIVKEGQDEHYRPRDVEFHRQLYAEKAMPFLRLETATPTETEKTIMELRKQLDKVQPLIDFVEAFENPETLKNFLSILRNVAAIDVSPKQDFAIITSSKLQEQFDEIARGRGFKDGNEMMKWIKRKAGKPRKEETQD